MASMTQRPPGIQSKDVDMHDAIERELSKPEPLAYAAAMDDNLSGLLGEEKRLRAFMEEPVTFMISETDNPNDPNPVGCGVNGVIKFFTRGVEYTVARKFVESLIKVTWRVRTINYKDSNGVDQTKIEHIPSMVYPISILHDPSGMGPNDAGRRWFIHQQRNG